MLTAVQGFIAAGTVSYLTRETSWENMAMMANHLFLLTGEMLRQVQMESPYFSLAAKVVFMLTPVLLSVHLYQPEKVNSTFAAHVRRFYYLAVVVSALVLAAWGNTAYGVSFLLVAVLDLIARRQEIDAYLKNIFKVTALLTFVSYAARLSTWQGKSLMMIVGAQLFVPKILAWLSNFSFPSSSSKDFRTKRRWGLNPCYQRYSYPVPNFSRPSSSFSSSTGSLKFLEKCTPALPHNM